MQSGSKREKLILALSVLVLLVSSALIFNDRLLDMLLYGHNRFYTEKIGVVQMAHSDVRRRPLRNLTWRPLEERESVYEGDSIYTGSQSEAMIYLSEGVELSIAPNSLVVLTKTAGHTDLTVAYGSVMGHSKKNAPVKININGRETELKSQHSTLAVKSNGHDTDLEVENDLLTLISPSEGQSFWLGPKTSDVSFQWESSNKKAKLELQVATTGDFHKLLLSKTVSGTSFVAQNFPTPNGPLYWRVKAQGTTTEPKRFFVYQDTAPALVGPADKAQVQTETVHLEWKDKSGAESFRLQLATDPDFKKLVQEKDSLEPGVQSDALQDGTYFWRVQALNQQRIDPPWSQTFQFAVKQPELTLPGQALNAPQVKNEISSVKLKSEARPQDWQNLDWRQQQKILKEKVANPPVLEWKPVEGASGYQIQITGKNDADFAHPYVDQSVRGNRFVWRSSVPGQFIWRVTALDDSGNQSQPSKDAQLRVSVPPPIALSSRQYQDRVPSSTDMDAPLKDVDLKWTPVIGAHSYEVQVAANPHFKDAQVYTIQDNTTKITPSQLGENYWRVRPLNANRAPVSVYSPTYDLNYQRLVELDPPIQMTPLSRSTLVVVGQGDAQFVLSWSKVERADKYLIELADNPKFDNPIIHQETSRQEFLVSKNLDSGRYFWRVQALGKEINSPWPQASAFLLRKEK